MSQEQRCLSVLTVVTQSVGDACLMQCLSQVWKVHASCNVAHVSGTRATPGDADRAGQERTATASGGQAAE